MELQGMAALVTGGAAGIGLECVTQLLDAGVKGVAILDVSEAAGRTAVTDLESRYGAGRAVFFQTDVTKDDQLKDAFQKAKDTFSGLDIVINNAGVPENRDWQLVIATNFMPQHTRRTGVRVMALCPGVTQTNMAAEALSMLGAGVMSEGLRELALRPAQQPDAVARAAVEMLRHAPSGSVWVVEGGEAPYPVRALSLDEQQSSDKPSNL